MGPLEKDLPLHTRMKAFRLALEDIRIRTALARDVMKERKEGMKSQFKIGEELKGLISELRLQKEIIIHLQEGPLKIFELAERLEYPEDKVLEAFSMLVKKGIVEREMLVMPDRLGSINIDER